MNLDVDMKQIRFMLTQMVERSLEKNKKNTYQPSASDVVTFVSTQMFMAPYNQPAAFFIRFCPQNVDP